MSATCKMLFPLAFMAKLHIHNNEHMTQQPAKVHCFTNRKTDNKTLKDKKNVPTTSIPANPNLHSV